MVITRNRQTEISQLSVAADLVRAASEPRGWHTYGMCQCAKNPHCVVFCAAVCSRDRPSNCVAKKKPYAEAAASETSEETGLSAERGRARGAGGRGGSAHPRAWGYGRRVTPVDRRVRAEMPSHSLLH